MVHGAWTYGTMKASGGDFVKGGHVTAALNEAQAMRVQAWVRAEREQGLAADELHELDAAALARRVRIAGGRGGAFSPHVARVHPVKLLAALLAAVEGLGVPVHEGTPVHELRAHEARTPAGPVRARWVVRATEGYTAALPGLHRVLAPVNSSMIITDPLPQAAWDEIGWAGEEVLSDAAHVHCYLQRTADGRIAIGGRGRPYRYRSATGGAGDTAAATVGSLKARLSRMFPCAASAQIDHAWSGVLGVPRDWCMSLQADPDTGLAWAGGYVGHGVTSANLAGRTLRDLILTRASALTRLPWVGRASRSWEPEPIRWAAINGLYAFYRQADRSERGRGRPARLAGLLDRVAGRV